MADNTTLSVGSGGDTIRTEDRTTYKTPVSLLDVGGTASEALIGDAGVYMPVAGAAAENAAAAGNPILVGARYDATPRTLNTGDVGAIAIDADGAVQVSDGGNSITIDGSVSLTGNLPDTAAGDLAAINTAVSGTLTVGSHAVTNAGVFAVQESGAALTALQLIDDAVYTDGTGTPSKGLAVMGTDGTNPQIISTNTTGHVNIADGGNTITVDGTVSVTGTVTVDGSGVTQPISAVSLPLPSGAAAETTLATVETNTDFGTVVGGGVEATALRVTIASDSTGVLTVDNGGTFATQAAQSGTWTVQPGNTANTTPWLVNDRPDTTGGLSLSKTVSAATTNATSVKGSAGQVYAVQVFNTNASPRYLKLYDKATAPTVGTDTPVKTLLIPGNANGAGMVLNWDKGLVFSNGIGFGTTTGMADSDTGAVGSEEIAVNLDYK